MDIKAVIEKINARCGHVTAFDPATVGPLGDFLKTLGSLSYIGNGGMCICLLKPSHNEKPAYVVKCCRKNKKTIVASKELFLSKIDELKSNQLDILYPLDFLYEDTRWFVYTQPLCRLIERWDLTPKMGCQMLDFIEKMIRSNLQMTDIYYRNFGIYKNRLHLFDFHEIENFNHVSGFLINNLYSNLVLLGRNLGWHKSEKLGPHLHFPDDGNTGEYQFPSVLSKFLLALKQNDTVEALEWLDKSRIYLGQSIESSHKELSGDKLDRKHRHQHLKVDPEGKIVVPSSSRSKYEIVDTFLKGKTHLLTILDARGGTDGIGLKLAQQFSDKIVTLSSSESGDLDKLKIVASNCLIYNINFIPVKSLTSDINNHLDTKKIYDLVIFYGLIHHLLRSSKIDDILRYVRSQTGRYCIIEAPIVGDHLLDKVMKASGKTEHFKCLGNPETFRHHLRSQNWKVHQCIRIDYKSRKFNRYAYICSL